MIPRDPRPPLPEGTVDLVEMTMIENHFERTGSHRWSQAEMSVLGKTRYRQAGRVTVRVNVGTVRPVLGGGDDQLLRYTIQIWCPQGWATVFERTTVPREFGGPEGLGMRLAIDLRTVDATFGRGENSL